MIETIVRLVVGVVLILANGFFVAAEFALTRLRQFSEAELGDSPRLRRAWEMTEELEIYLTGCQLGISSTSILLGIVAEPGVTSLIERVTGLTGIGAGSRHAISVVIAIILINLVHKIWGEQAPTYLGVEKPLAVATRTSTPLYWWTRIMKPIILAGDGLAKSTLRLFGVEMQRSWTDTEHGEDGASATPPGSRTELRRQMADLLARGELPEDRQREVMRAFELGSMPVRDIMVPRENIVALRTGDGVDRNLRRLENHAFSRLPLVGDTLEEFRGVVYVPGLIGRLDELRDGRVSFDELDVPSFTVPADLPVSEVIDRFQQERQELALVLEGERVVGLVTTTDTFEAIAGDLQDPFDRPA